VLGSQPALGPHSGTVAVLAADCVHHAAVTAIRSVYTCIAEATTVRSLVASGGRCRMCACAVFLPVYRIL
jgi:hypothetical protein